MGSLFNMQRFALKDVEGMVGVSSLRNVNVTEGGKDEDVKQVCCL